MGRVLAPSAQLSLLLMTLNSPQLTAALGGCSRTLTSHQVCVCCSLSTFCLSWDPQYLQPQHQAQSRRQQPDLESSC